MRQFADETMGKRADQTMKACQWFTRRLEGGNVLNEDIFVSISI